MSQGIEWREVKYVMPKIVLKFGAAVAEDATEDREDSTFSSSEPPRGAFRDALEAFREPAMMTLRGDVSGLEWEVVGVRLLRPVAEQEATLVVTLHLHSLSWTKCAVLTSAPIPCSMVALRWEALCQEAARYRRGSRCQLELVEGAA